MSLPLFSMIEITANSWLSSHTWQENVPCPVPPEKMAQWQKRLNQIFGQVDGAPVVKVIWGQSPDTFFFNRYKKEWIPRFDWGYVSEYVKDPATGIDLEQRKWIGLPRLLLVRALKPQAETVQTQNGHDNEGLSVAKHIPSGPLEYRLMTLGHKSGIIVQHNETLTAQGEYLCCAKRREQGINICYGDYRELDETDFTVLQREEQQAAMQHKAHAAGITL